MNPIAWMLSRGADRQVRKYRERAERIGKLEPKYQAMSDDELRKQTDLLRARLESGETESDILDDAFAVVREASVRTLGMRHFDEQLMAAMALNDHMIAEASTGSGKTLACTPAVYLNALSGHGVHVVTVNDYLATRDQAQMSAIYGFLGVTSACITNQMSPESRKAAYQADITYGTNSEFGFDYLRDNMVMYASDRVQRGHHFAIVDEVDSILIDEARTPLIISAAGQDADEVYRKFALAVKPLIEDVDYIKDEAKRTIAITETGLARVEHAVGTDIYADASGSMVNHLQNALKANFLFTRDIDYLVNDEGEVLIVDEFTGRVLPGRRYSEGLHQAIEAKEGVRVQSENETLATITLQNYFRMYDKLSGMTGTAMTEDAEFRSTYNLPVVAIPDHKPCIRHDDHDLIYATTRDKYTAICEVVAERHAAGQPCLIGTTSIESSEALSRQLQKHGIPHNVLNAKNHAREAQIVAQAGRLGAVTVATNMAGRGTDIKLGGSPDMLAEQILAESGITPDEANDEARTNALAQAKAICDAEAPKVASAGGLFVIGSERHESRRIDNQLRGRSGRQGDPGRTQFFLSLEDDLVRKFAGDNAEKMKQTFIAGYKGDTPEPLSGHAVSKIIEQAQHNIEEINFASRKSVLEYDDVLNRQRQAIYDERNHVLDGADLIAEKDETINQMVDLVAQDANYDVAKLAMWLTTLSPHEDVDGIGNTDDVDDIADNLKNQVSKMFDRKVERIGRPLADRMCSQILMRVIDIRWRTYLQEMDYLKTGIGLRSFGQRDPLVEYKREAFSGFESLIATMYTDYVRAFLNLEIQQPKPADAA
jgi:preprotein translocase subunit SecA